MRRVLLGLTACMTAGAVGTLGQVTGTPSYNAPYRAFANYEAGVTLSFGEGDATGVEGQVSFGQGTWDIGFRGGFVDDAGGTEVVLGGGGRVRVLTHSEAFPFDGAFVVGGGTQGFDNFIVPAGLALGRRLDVEGSQVSIVPYVQPTLFMIFDDNANNDTANIALGFGADFRLSKMVDVRLSASIGDREGIGLSVVWIR